MARVAAALLAVKLTHGRLPSPFSRPAPPHRHPPRSSSPTALIGCSFAETGRALHSLLDCPPRREQDRLDPEGTGARIHCGLPSAGGRSRD